MSNQYIYGTHAVKSLLKNKQREVEKIILSKERQDKEIQTILELAVSEGINIEYEKLSDLNKKFPNIVHQGIIAITQNIREYSESDLDMLIEKSERKPLILILDGITDPHNLGACLRSADAFGVDFVIIPKDKNVGITPIVSKVACGAAETIPLVKVTNLVRALEKIKGLGIWIFGADGEAQGQISDHDFTGAVALALGAEGKGLRRLTREHCDFLVSIPMVGSVESLNVSVATGIGLYEVLRQRNQKER